MIKNNFEHFLNKMSISKINLLLTNYRNLNISDQEIIVILQIENIKLQNLSVNPKKISNSTEMSLKDVNNILTKLIDKKLLSIYNIENKINFSFNNLYYKILHFNFVENNIINNIGLTFLLDAIEKLLNRTLSESEISKIRTSFKTDGDAHKIISKIELAQQDNSLPKPFHIDWLYEQKNQRNQNIDYNWLKDETEI